VVNRRTAATREQFGLVKGHVRVILRPMKGILRVSMSVRLDQGVKRAYDNAEQDVDDVAPYGRSERQDTVVEREAITEEVLGWHAHHEGPNWA